LPFGRGAGRRTGLVHSRRTVGVHVGIDMGIDMGMDMSMGMGIGIGVRAASADALLAAGVRNGV
jgi:hypothetical protein